MATFGRSLVSALFLVGLVTGVSHGWQPEPIQTPVLSVRTELVVLPVTVVARDGHLVSNLTQEQFTVYDNDKLQPVTFFVREDAPITVGFVVDNSGSMRGRRDQLLAAAAAFVRLSNPLDELFTLNFNERVTRGLPPGITFTDNPEQLQVALATLTARGMTALYDATIAALEQVESGSKRRKILILVSDGGDNASQAGFSGAMISTQSSNTAIYTVALVDPFDQESDPGRLSKLAATSGGVAFAPHDIAGVDQSLQQIARDIRHSYTIGYEPPSTRRPPGFHRLRVEVRSPDGRKMVTRTREGYHAL